MQLLQLTILTLVCLLLHSCGFLCLDVAQTSRSRTNSASGIGETDFVLLQSSPVSHMHWQPISISIQGTSESLSEHSSRCSSQLPSPGCNSNFIKNKTILIRTCIFFQWLKENVPTASKCQI